MEISVQTARKVMDAIYQSPTNEDIELVLKIGSESESPIEFANNICETWEIEKRNNRSAILRVFIVKKED